MKLTKQQRLNLAYLARYLFTLPEDYAHFGMEKYNEDLSDYPDLDTVRIKLSKDACGTVACALGHGVYVPELRHIHMNEYLVTAGIRTGVQWDSYRRDIFGIDLANFDFVFGDDWAEYDNTPKGAAQRITMFLLQENPYNGSSDPQFFESFFDFKDLLLKAEYQKIKSDQLEKIIEGLKKRS